MKKIYPFLCVFFSLFSCFVFADDVSEEKAFKSTVQLYKTDYSSYRAKALEVLDSDLNKLKKQLEDASKNHLNTDDLQKQINDKKAFRAAVSDKVFFALPPFKAQKSDLLFKNSLVSLGGFSSAHVKNISGNPVLKLSFPAKLEQVEDSVVQVKRADKKGFNEVHNPIRKDVDATKYFYVVIPKKEKVNPSQELLYVTEFLAHIDGVKPNSLPDAVSKDKNASVGFLFDAQKIHDAAFPVKK